MRGIAPTLRPISRMAPSCTEWSIYVIDEMGFSEHRLLIGNFITFYKIRDTTEMKFIGSPLRMLSVFWFQSPTIQ